MMMMKKYFDDEGDDDDNDNDELFLRNGWATKDVYPYFQPGTLSEILTISNLRHAPNRIWLITAWCCLSIPPENTKKHLGFLMFSGGIDKQHQVLMG